MVVKVYRRLLGHDSLRAPTSVTRGAPRRGRLEHTGSRKEQCHYPTPHQKPDGRLVRARAGGKGAQGHDRFGWHKPGHEGRTPPSPTCRPVGLQVPGLGPQGAPNGAPCISSTAFQDHGTTLASPGPDGISEPRGRTSRRNVQEENQVKRSGDVAFDDRALRRRHRTRGYTPASGGPPLLALLILTWGVLPHPVSAQDSPEEVVRFVDDLLRGESSRGTVTMEVVTNRWQRSMEMEMWSLGQDHSLVRVLSPARDAGTATLKVGRDIWNYLPRVDRTIKVPGAGMGGSWMGSHFTYDDLVRESSLVDDFKIQAGAARDRDGTAVREYLLTPRPEAPVVWSRLELEVRESDRMPLSIRYYDDRDGLARTMAFSEFRTMGGRLVPSRLSMRPEDRPGESTTLLYQELEFNIGLEATFFSLQRLRSGP